MRDRARAHALVASHARSAGIDTTSPEFRQFARELFHIARQCGAAGLGDESRLLVKLAREIADARDLCIYETVARAIGWKNAGRGAAWLDRLRSAAP